jgi:hypothetical protein
MEADPMTQKLGRITIVECRCSACERFHLALFAHVEARRHGEGETTIRELRAATKEVDETHHLTTPPEAYN